MDNARWQAVYDEKSSRILGRLKRGTDVMEGFKEICHHFNVKAAQVQCIGSLDYVTFVQAKRAEEPGKMTYSEVLKTNSGVELVNATGFIGLNDDTEELEIHIHGSFVDCDRQFNAGHFIEGGSPTYATVEYIIHVVHGANVLRKMDTDLKVPFFQFYKGEA